MDFVKDMVAAIEDAGVKVVSSVPDTWIARVIEGLDASETVKHASAAREEDALGICCGAALAGVRAICLVQNAGILNTGGVLGTLANLYGVPVVLIIADRGHLGDVTIHHFEKGRSLKPFLESLRIPYYELYPDFKKRDQIDQALQMAEKGQKPVALLITPNTLGD